jgi:ATP-binding cassette, subfamily B, heavy metal transporter
MSKIYRLYYHFLWRYKWKFIIFILASILSSVTYSVQPYFYKLFIDKISSHDFSILFRILIGYIIFRILELIFDNLTYFIGDMVVIPAARDTRLAVFRKVQNLDFAYHTSKSTGSLISIFKRGDDAFFEIHNTLHVNLLHIIVNFFIVLYFFYQINWQIGLLVFVTFIIIGILSKFLIKKNIKARSLFNRQEDKISSIVVDNLINYETVKLFAKEDREYSRLKKHFLPWQNSLWKFVNTFRLIDISVGSISNISLFFILLLGLQKLSHLEITTGDYVMIIGFISSFYSRFFEMIYQLRSLAKHQTDIKKYISILSLDNSVKDPDIPVKKTTVNGLLEFKNLDFAYPENKNLALKNINLTINPGESIALVGHSGTGKTTIIKLLMRFFDPSSGNICIDGIDIKKFTKSQLRSFMGVVPQEPILFNRSIGYNIAYGADNASLKDVKKAAQLANLDDFIDTLPKKYHTQVGERGVKLSGGQKQRLAIARMILSNPDIIIFDEATSQLDSDSEKMIQQAFWQASKGKTTLIIAHRLSTVVKADRIIVMNQGSIVETGSHSQLIANPNSLYSHFWSLQTQS